MSGHSKWATIHRQKEANDSKRGAAFTRLSQAITLAVRQGGGIGDPEKNFRLRLAIEKARAANMPKDNIQRAIDRAAGAGDGVTLSELTFEGFLPGGAAVLVDVLTDNKLRTAQQVREVLDRGGGSMGSSGAVAYLFGQVGEVRIKAAGLTDDDELKIIDIGATDISREGGSWVIYCEKDNTFELKNKLEASGYTIEETGLVMRPGSFVEVDGEAEEKAVAILSKLDDLDDVTHVWTNMG
jgi:YebC/PmpR family DNA-binding regulatory protein